MTRRVSETVTTGVALGGEGAYRRTTFSIAAGAGLASFAMGFWWPFLPFYLRELGAESDAAALFWVGVATASQGVVRLISGPIWGILADRYGRKLMFIRSLYAATLTTVIAAFATQPWHIVVALTGQGLFSGFIPAAIAFTSVSVPDARLNSSLGNVTGGQYLGNTLGPSAGAILAGVLGYRWAILVGGLLPSLAATWVAFSVPADQVASRKKRSDTGVATEGPTDPGGGRGFTRTFYVALVLYFGLFALSQLVRVGTPIALKDITGPENARTAAGVSFTLAGAASVIGVLLVGRWVSWRFSLRQSLVGFCVAAGLFHPLLSVGGSLVLYMTGFTLISLVLAAATPASNTLIAGTVAPARRGTAFGVASSAQAFAFMVGPMGSALFASWSLAAGFLFTGGCYLLLAAIVGFGVRNADLER